MQKKMASSSSKMQIRSRLFGQRNLG